MKKINNKGFMMAEVVVVSAVILVALSVFYVSYNKLISLYNERLSYYDPTTLYRLADYRNANYMSLDLTKTNIKSETINGRTYNLYLTLGTKLSNLDTSDKNKTFRNYVNYLDGSLSNSVKNNYLMLMENCKNDKTDCKYAYLETLVSDRTPVVVGSVKNIEIAFVPVIEDIPSIAKNENAVKALNDMYQEINRVNSGNSSVKFLTDIYCSDLNTCAAGTSSETFKVSSFDSSRMLPTVWDEYFWGALDSSSASLAAIIRRLETNVSNYKYVFLIVIGDMNTKVSVKGPYDNERNADLLNYCTDYASCVKKLNDNPNVKYIVIGQYGGVYDFNDSNVDFSKIIRDIVDENK